MFKHVIEEGLELKLLDYHHAEEIFQLVDTNREYLREWLPWVDATKTVEDSKEFIKFTKKQFGENRGLQVGIWYEGQLAGTLGYHDFNLSNKSTSIGYWLAAKFQVKGIMTKATKALVNYALVDLGLNRVEIRCGEGNFKSGAIAEKLGFKKEGIIRDSEWLYDQYVNHIVYGMLAKDWKIDNI